MSKSYVATILSSWRSGSVEERDRQRVLAILMKARTIVETRYGAHFVVILWNEGPVSAGRSMRARTEWLRHNLERSGFRTLVVSDIESAPTSPRHYIPHDGHPNALGYTPVAKAVASLVNRFAKR